MDQKVASPKDTTMHGTPDCPADVSGTETTALEGKKTGQVSKALPTIKPEKKDYVVIKKDEKYNFVNSDGILLSDIWLDDAEEFHEGFACVKLDGQWNHVDLCGKYLSETWFDVLGFFSEGLAWVFEDHKCNVIDTTGRLIFDSWFSFSSVIVFREGFSVV